MILYLQIEITRQEFTWDYKIDGFYEGMLFQLSFLFALIFYTADGNCAHRVAIVGANDPLDGRHSLFRSDIPISAI